MFQYVNLKNKQIKSLDLLLWYLLNKFKYN